MRFTSLRRFRGIHGCLTISYWIPFSSSALRTRQHGCCSCFTNVSGQEWNLIAMRTSGGAGCRAYDTTVRAVVLDGDGHPELAELPEPEGPGLLVRVRACGLCGSDVEKLGRWPAGTVLGHEVAGELE